MTDEVFFDSNIICYAFDLREPGKRGVCLELMKRVLNSEIRGVVSNQVLGEVFHATVRKFGLPADQAFTIIDGMFQSDKWKKVDYTCETIDRAARKSGQSRIQFWDAVILETMKENGIRKIITENVRDFAGISGIEVANPFL